MPISVDLVEGMSRAERMEHLRVRLAGVGPRQAEQAAQATLAVPEPVAHLLPHRGIVRGTVVSVSGAASLLVGMLAAATGTGHHAAVIGVPRLGLLAAAEMGAELSRIAVIPDPGPDAVEVAAVLLDGMDMVVLGLGGASVSPSRARAVIARARTKGSVLVVTDGRWESAELRLDARVDGYGGIGEGHGRVRSVHLEVSVQGRALRPRTTHLEVVHTGGEILWREQYAREAQHLPIPMAVPS